MEMIRYRKVYAMKYQKTARRLAAGRKNNLKIETLEDRITPAVLWVDNTPGTAGTEFTSTGGTQPASVAALTPGTNLFSTISMAVNVAVTGDVINVSDGIYSENVDITGKVIAIRGNQAGIDARLRSASVETTFVSAVVGTGTVVINTGGATVVDGFNFTGGTSLGVIQTQAGTGYDNLQIVNNRMSGYSQSAIFMNRGGTDISIDKNVMDGSLIASSGQAIFLNGPQIFNGIVISNNDIINHTGRTGLFVDGNHNVGPSVSRSPAITDNRFENNTTGANLGRFSFDRGNVSSNIFNLNLFDGLQGGIQNSTIARNTFSNNGRWGLNLTPISADPTDPLKGAFGNLVTENFFVGNSVGDIVLSDGQFPGTIGTNAIHGNSILGLVGVSYRGAEIIDAGQNWWGSNSQPVIASKLQTFNNERQWFGIKNSVTGTFTLSFNGNTTAPFTTNSASSLPSAATVQSALELLPGIGVGNVAVSLSGSSQDVFRRFYTIEFQNLLASTNVSQLVMDDALLVGSTAPRTAIATLTDGGQTLNTVDYTPWLDRGVDINPAIPGFQGDFSILNADDASPQAGGIGRIQEAIDVSTPVGTVIVADGSYIGGANATVGALLISAGAGPMLVALAGDFVLDENDTFRTDINTSVPGTGYDQWQVVGAVMLGNATLLATGTRAANNGDVLTLIRNDGTDAVNGTFQGLPEGAMVTVNGVNYAITYLYNAESATAGNGNDVALLDNLGVTVTVAPASTPEDGAGNLVYTFTRNGTGGVLTVDFSVGGTAQFGTDYSQVGASSYTATSGSVTFGAGSATASVVLDPTADGVVEADETAVLTVLAGAGYNPSGLAASGTITNEDSDVSVAVAPASVVEDGVVGLVYTFTRSGFTGGVLTVDFSVGGTAQFGTDYSQVGASSYTATSGSVTFGAGSATASVVLDPTADGVVEADETAVLTVLAGAGYNPSGLAASGTITNDDSTIVTLSLTGSPLAENGGVATVTASLSNPSSLPVTVNLGFTGTAAPGDFSASATTIVIPAGSLTGSITLTGVNDSVLESAESVIVDVASVLGGTESGEQQVTAMVVDDDQSPQAAPARQFAIAGTVNGLTTVRVYNSDGTSAYQIAAGNGDDRIAVGDVTGDGVEDVVIGSGIGTPALVRVFDGTTRLQIASFSPFEVFTGGVFLALGDFNEDGIRDIVATPDQGGGPRVVIVRGGVFQNVASFFGINDPAFRGGVRAAVGDVNADGRPDLSVSAGFLGGPRVAVFDGTTVLSGAPTLLVNDFFAFEPTLRNGAYVAMGDLNGDGFEDLIFGAGLGGSPRVLAISGQLLMTQGSDAAIATPLASFFGGDPDNRSGIRVASKILVGDSQADILTGDGSGTQMTAYQGDDLAILFTLSSGSDAAGAFNGVFVG